MVLVANFFSMQKQLMQVVLALGKKVPDFSNGREDGTWKQCFLVCPPLGNMARKQCFVVCLPSRNMARKQCFLVCPPSGNMATKQCFLVCPPSRNIAGKCVLVCPPLRNMARKEYVLLAVIILSLLCLGILDQPQWRDLRES